LPCRSALRLTCPAARDGLTCPAARDGGSLAPPPCPAPMPGPPRRPRSGPRRIRAPRGLRQRSRASTRHRVRAPRGIRRLLTSPRIRTLGRARTLGGAPGSRLTRGLRASGQRRATRHRAAACRATRHRAAACRAARCRIARHRAAACRAARHRTAACRAARCRAAACRAARCRAAACRWRRACRRRPAGAWTGGLGVAARCGSSLGRLSGRRPAAGRLLARGSAAGRGARGQPRRSRRHLVSRDLRGARHVPGPHRGADRYLRSRYHARPPFWPPGICRRPAHGRPTQSQYARMPGPSACAAVRTRHPSAPSGTVTRGHNSSTRPSLNSRIIRAASVLLATRPAGDRG